VQVLSGLRSGIHHSADGGAEVDRRCVERERQAAGGGRLHGVGDRERGGELARGGPRDAELPAEGSRHARHHVGARANGEGKFVLAARHQLARPAAMPVVCVDCVAAPECNVSLRRQS